MDHVATIFFEGLRVLFLLGVPLIVASVFGGVLASVMQSFIALHEPAVGYAARLGAVIIALYFLSPTILQSLQELFLLALHQP